jgi:acetyl esterase/lipase
MPKKAVAWVKSNIAGYGGDPDFVAVSGGSAGGHLAALHAAAPPFLVLYGGNDTLVPVAVARTFVCARRSVSQAPVGYIELPLAQHAFDVLASLRCQATTGGVAAFLDAVRATARGQSSTAFPPSVPS